MGLRKRLRPEDLPVAGRKNWYYEQRACGPLNGAMVHLTNIGPLEMVPRYEKLNVHDINRFSQITSDNAGLSSVQVEADWNQHKVYRPSKSPRRHQSGENHLNSSVDLPSKIRDHRPSDLVRTGSLQEM